MILKIFLATIICTSFLTLALGEKGKAIVALTKILMPLLLLLAIFNALYQQQDVHYVLEFLNFDNIKLAISIQLDMLTKIMMIFILTIGCFIYCYAQNYLESDSTRLRFLSQLNLVIFSVLLLVMSANLLTAFVAWQFIGISLYLLLNHYHHDPAANRAAKKKFVINRIGDCSFLLAIILAYQTQNTESFASIQTSPHAAAICSLLFISVMTKCAQFPFHLWLIDTMETPTPVSALMHAGVINAGGILLTRVSGALIHFHYLAYSILLVGLINAILSIHWMNQQPDTKKKLAYSTMGQMGYMLTQCGLGIFPGAIFHLVSHGFYKASLFLNAGETLGKSEPDKSLSFSHLCVLKSFLISLTILASGFLIFREEAIKFPALMYAFVLITITSLILKLNQIETSSWKTRILSYTIITLFFNLYLCFLNLFSSLLSRYNYIATISIKIQVILIICIFTPQYILWTNPRIKLKNTLFFKDRTEHLFRIYLLNPLRSLGDICNLSRYKKSTVICTALITILMISLLIFGLLHHKIYSGHRNDLYTPLIFLFLLTCIYALLVGNRCLKIKSLMLYLILFEISFTNIALFDGSSGIVKIGYFHLIIITSILIMLALLSNGSNGRKTSAQNTNHLPTRIFYLVFSLLLLIGIPGTASFISEFYLLKVLINTNPLFIFMYISSIILLAIVVMHSLQLYAFSQNYLNLLLKPITKKEHLLFLLIITFNLACGLWPGILLNHILN